ncbi:hypothetical protein GCM10010423_65610 [Streptomyces levis]|uniref:VWFA domain-containing protein n=1 Tax=Streptomyces levis TaxID=285566 RepID=A0ABP6BCZ7_9ACTN
MSTPNLPEAVQQWKDRQVARLGALATTLTTTDRILTGRRDVGVKFKSQGADFTGRKVKNVPAYTDGKNISINDHMLPDLRTKQGLVTTLGLNYHELAHNMFTPGAGTQLVRSLKREGGGDWDMTFNLLEDARIESLLVSKYKSAAKFLSAPVLEFIIKDEKTWPTAHLFTHGRRFLRKDVRRELRNFFEGDDSIRDECEQIIDEYRVLDLSFEKNHGRALELIKRLHEIMNGPLSQCLTQEEKDAMNQHGACGGIGSPFGDFQNKLMDIKKESQEASRRMQDDDAAEEEDEEEEDASEDAAPEGEMDDEDDIEDEEGPEEQPEGDSGDVGDDQEDDGDDIEDEDDYEDGDGGEDDEEDIDSGDDQDGVSGDESEDGDDSTQGGTEGGSAGVGTGDVGDDDDASGDASDDVDGQPGGVGAGVGAGSIEDLAEALAGAIEDLEEDSDVESEVSRLREAMDDDTLLDTVMPEIPYRDAPVEAAAAQSASVVTRELQKLNTQFEAGWDYGSDYGRLNTQLAMTADWGDMNIFDHWEEGREMDAALEAFFAVDRSSSMSGYYGNKDLMGPACKALWVIKRALDDVDALSTVCTFDDGSPHKLYGRGEKANPSSIRMVTPSGGTNPLPVINEGRRILNTSERPNKLFGIITDGDWNGNTSGIVDQLNAIRGTRVFIGIGTSCNPRFREAFDVVATINEPRDIIEVIRQCVVSMLNEAAKRR